MIQIEYNTNVPEELLAVDEVLLKKAENGEGEESIRLWEAKDYFVVLGRACKVKDDCFIDKCSDDKIKIIRRTSGGGSILQGPGCLNYSAVLSYDTNKMYKGINSSYEEILGRIVNLFMADGVNIEFLPLSDLAFNGKKVSGNSQTRKHSFFLHHGTLLYDFDIMRVGQYIKHPSKEPEYRKARNHSDFLGNLKVQRKEIEEMLIRAFSTGRRVVIELGEEDIKSVKDLARNKYSIKEWNYCF